MEILIFILVSLFLISAGLYELYARFKADKVIAKITKIEILKEENRTRNTTYITYTYNGEKFENINLDYWQRGYKKGQKINIYIFPNKPEKPRSGTIFYLLTGILLLIVTIIVYTYGDVTVNI